MSRTSWPTGEKPVDKRQNPSYIFLMKKRYLAILFALSLLLVSCLNWVMENPTIVLREINIKPRSLTEVNVLFGLDVHNPNRFDLTLKSFEYAVYLNHEEIGSGRLEKELMIPSSSLTRVQIPVTATFKNWQTSLKAVLMNEALPYRIVGKTQIKAAFGSLEYPFSKEGHINLTRH